MVPVLVAGPPLAFIEEILHPRAGDQMDIAGLHLRFKRLGASLFRSGYFVGARAQAGEIPDGVLRRLFATGARLLFDPDLIALANPLISVGYGLDALLAVKRAPAAALYIFDDMSTPEQNCISLPEQKYINDAGKKAPNWGPFVLHQAWVGLSPGVSELARREWRLL